ncbi:uncharacterized protein LOC128962530 [Oppia nitens]|uniref:uncharacterized protein LOC128962530 n=1 Tax=Oppia nitens TaxID=1686743 RepID=UPI0023DCA808|nr:uncharacterized protein LOC128962530 [Oppia nitens]
MNNNNLNSNELTLNSQQQPISSTLSPTSPTFVMSMSDTLSGNGNTNNLSQAQALSDSVLNNPQQFIGRNGSARQRGLVHSVSIIVEPAMTDSNDDDDGFGPERPSMPSVSTERRNTIAGPIVVLEDYAFETPRKAREEDDIVQSIIAHARLRKEEFARLLEEHAQIVNEINRAETSLL